MIGHRRWTGVALATVGVLLAPAPAPAHADPHDAIKCTGQADGATVAFTPALSQTRQTVRATSSDGKVSGCTGSAAGITRAELRTSDTATLSITAQCTELKGSGSGLVEVTWFKQDTEVGKSTVTVIADMANLLAGKDLLVGNVKEGTPAEFNGGSLDGKADLDQADYAAIAACKDNAKPLDSIRLNITMLRIVQQ